MKTYFCRVSRREIAGEAGQFHVRNYINRKIAPRLIAVVLSGLPVLAPAQVAAPDSAAAPVPAYITRDIAGARPSGSGRFTWFGLHIYDARLYVPERGIDISDLASQRFALELAYARRLGGSAIAERSRDEIEKLKLGSEEQLAEWLLQMKKIFPDVTAGQTLTGVHLAGGATRFYFDGRFIGAIDDPAFGRAFFAIWLDPKTSAPRLRTELLQRAAP